MEIRKTVTKDYSTIASIYEYARSFMKENGNPTQWGDNRPTENAIKKDISEGNSYVITRNQEIVGVFSFFVGHDYTYDVIREGKWLNDGEYGVIHKIASAKGATGVLKAALDYAEKRCDNLRIDTHSNNEVMQHLLLKNGYTYCGLINTDDGTERLAYQKVIRTVRLATDSDKQRILAHYKAQLGTPFCMWDEDYPDMREIDFDISRHALFIMVDNEDRLIATISIDDDENVNVMKCWSKDLSPGAELSRLAVDINYQNQGIARKMIQAMFPIIKERGYKSVKYLVHKENKKAINSYKHLHFNLVGECRLYEEDFLCYEKEIE